MLPCLQINSIRVIGLLDVPLVITLFAQIMSFGGQSSLGRFPFSKYEFNDALWDVQNSEACFITNYQSVLLHNLCNLLYLLMLQCCWSSDLSKQLCMYTEIIYLFSLFTYKYYWRLKLCSFWRWWLGVQSKGDEDICTHRFFSFWFFLHRLFY